MIYPSFPKKGDVLGICAPSAGVGHKPEEFDLAVKNLKKAGYRVKETASVRVDGIRSAEAEQRADELAELFADDSVNTIMAATGGDFLYEKEEILMMAAQMEELRKLGADGFVIGCLTPEGELDGKAMEPLLKAAEGTGLTLHRCIDVSRDPARTYLAAKELGFDTVLTSGAAGSCTLGAETIGKLLALRDEQAGPEVLVGGGVKASVIADFKKRFPGIRAFHMSGKTEIESGMRFRREGVPMGLPGLDEWHIQQTGVENVRAARRAMDE